MCAGGGHLWLGRPLDRQERSVVLASSLLPLAGNAKHFPQIAESVGFPNELPRPSEKVVWQLIRPYAEAAGVPGIAPHDCRRTCAKLCRAAGGELEQIQLLLGHASVQTTERYLGTKQDLVHAPNDGIKLRIALTS